MADNHLIHPVVLSGGAGTRLWPVSRHLKPKQFQPIVSENSLFSETIGRLVQDRFSNPIVVCNSDHRFLVAEGFRASGRNAQAIVLEPSARNTAPAIAAAAFLLSKTQPDALMAVLPSDHVIGDISAFYRSLDRAVDAALAGFLVTFGITPTCPETGYGYIQAGEGLQGFDGAHKIEKFVEKPDAVTAKGYLSEGSYYWNSGMFLFRVSDFLTELTHYAPTIYENCLAATEHAREDMGFLKLDEAAFAASPSISIDYAVMEKTNRSAVVPSEFGWNDVGSWASLHEIGVHDKRGNVVVGDVVLEGTKNSYVRSEGTLVTAVGIENMVVVATDDAVLVAPLARDQDVRQAVETLKIQNRPEVISHQRVFKPWGSYKNLQISIDYLVKELVVNPGAKLSLQYHHHRSEHWVVVEGIARVTNGEDVFELSTNQSTYIGVGVQHRLENIGTSVLKIIEVQTGPIISEDDIVRVEDDFGRH